MVTLMRGVKGMALDGKLWWRIWRRDLRCNLSWLPVGCLSLTEISVLVEELGQVSAAWNRPLRP